MSQVDAVGVPPVRSWDDYERGCYATFCGGHHEPVEIECYQHGMGTVFNLIRSEFPAAQLCKAAPDLLAACEAVLSSPTYGNEPSDEAVDMVRAAIAKALGGKIV